MADKIYLSRLFPMVRSLDTDSLMIDNDSMYMITTPRFTQQIKQIILKYIKDSYTSRIIDATGGVGGDTISFSTYFCHVTAIENDPKRFEFISHNVAVYKLNNVTLVNDDCLRVLPSLDKIDVIYIDPPWGGRNYKNQHNITLSIGDKPIENVIEDMFDEKIMTCIPRIVVVKLPVNYNVYHFNDVLDEQKYIVHVYDLTKMLIVVISRKVD